MPRAEKLPRLLLTLTLALTAFALGAAQDTKQKSPTASAPARQDRKTPPLDRAGASVPLVTCRECHEAEADRILAGVHAQVPKDPALKACETCHGPGKAHTDDTKAASITFPHELPVAEKEALCARCHADQMREHGGDPAGFVLAGKTCTDCHKVHRPAGDEPGATEKRRFNSRGELASHATPAGGNACVSCHPRKEQQLARSDHASLIPSIEPSGCETCHGNGSLHANTMGLAGVITRPDRATDVKETCRECHPAVDPVEFHWKGKRTPLLTPGLTCTSCHKIHQERTPRRTRTDPHTGSVLRSEVKSAPFASDLVRAADPFRAGPFPADVVRADPVQSQPAPANTARFAGNEACIRCHAPAFAAAPNSGGASLRANVDAARMTGHLGLAGTIHGSLAAASAPLGSGCEGCHGPGAEHAAGPGRPGLIAALRDTDAAGQAKVCLTCHGKARTLTHIAAGTHRRHDVGCLSCHSPGAGVVHEDMRRDAEKNCGTCHRDVAAEFRMPNHHRVPEGAMFCSDCHEPHGARPKINDLVLKRASCAKCHREYAGPFVFEHQAHRSEGCVVCHTPHGSTNLRMLKQHRTQQNCLQCHGDFPAFHDQTMGSVFTNCVSCHTELHGSNTSRYFFR